MFPWFSGVGLLDDHHLATLGGCSCRQGQRPGLAAPADVMPAEAIGHDLPGLVMVPAVQSSCRYDTNAVQLTDPVTFPVVWGIVDLAEVVFNAARDGDDEEPGRLVRSPEPVRAAPGQEHEAAPGSIEHFAAAADRQFAVEHVEALILAVMDMQRRSGGDAGLNNAERPAGGVL
jgi:hypothetical protein